MSMRAAGFKGAGPDLEPILAVQARYSIEFPKVAGDESEPEAARMTGDQQVVWADDATSFQQIGFDFGGMDCGIAVKIQNFNVKKKLIQLNAVPLRRIGSQHAFVQFVQYYSRDCQVSSFSNEPGA